MQALQERQWLTDQYLHLDLNAKTEEDTVNLLERIKFLKASQIPFTVVLSGATEDTRKKLSHTILSFPVMEREYLAKGGLSSVSTLEGQNEKKEILKTPLDVEHAEIFEKALNPLVYSRLAREIKHPRLAEIVGISRVFDFQNGIEREMTSISEEFIDAEGTMEDFLNIENGITDNVTRKLSNEEKKRLFLELLSAVDYLNQNGIIHRDLKPNNILLVQDKDGQLHIKIIDFGISKLKGDTNDASGQISGTLSYMPLTDASEDEVTANYDIYSLGRIAVKMFYPEIWARFVADKTGAMRMVYGIPQELIKDGSNYQNKEITNCIVKMLEMNSSDRFQNLNPVIEIFAKHFIEEEIGLDDTLVSMAA